MSDTTPTQPRPDHTPPAGSRFRRRAAFAAALVGAGAFGAGATALAKRHEERPVLVSFAPAPISAMKDWSPVAVKGRVAELFGSTFILSDESGRALVETGPRGEDGKLVAKDETVTVQGRFEHGSVHAEAIRHGDGRTDLVGPPGPPPFRHGPWS